MDMQHNLKSKKNFILIIVSFWIVMSIIYHNFWYIDLDNIGEMKPVESIKSSNGEYEVIVSVWYPNRDENNYYIHCDAIKVVALPDKSELISDWNSHKIYWQKIEGTYNGEEIPVKWIREYKTMINEQVIDVRGIGYDYRWYSKKWK